DVLGKTLGNVAHQPADIGHEVDAIELVGAVDLLVNGHHRLDPPRNVRLEICGDWLEADQGRDRLQIVLDPVVDFPEQEAVALYGNFQLPAPVRILVQQRCDPQRSYRH